MPAPCGARWRKPSDEITDRAARYRANTRECRPLGSPICAFCGTVRTVEVHHLDGEERNTDPANLVWACRRCNTLIAFVMKRAGIGRRTRQFNPDSEGAQTLAQWVTAVLALHGKSDAMSLQDAITLVRATPADQRSRFAQSIWRIRRERGTDRR